MLDGLTTAPTITEMTTAKNIADYLVKKFPGYPWLVRVDRGLVRITCANLSNLWGYTLHEDKIDPDYRAVLKAGGEILERFNAPRERYIHDVFMNLRREHGLPAFER